MWVGATVTTCCSGGNPPVCQLWVLPADEGADDSLARKDLVVPATGD
jgi:hypothetical protein